MYYIYLINCEKNKNYVGMTSNLKKRMACHKSLLFRDLNFESFLICSHKSKKRALEIESYWTIKLRSSDPLYGYNNSCGNKFSEKTKLKMSVSQKLRTDRPFLGKKHSLESREKMSLSKKGVTPNICGHNSRQVINLDTLESFESITSASKKHKLNKSSVMRVCKGTQKTAGGFRFQYL